MVLNLNGLKNYGSRCVSKERKKVILKMSNKTKWFRVSIFLTLLVLFAPMHAQNVNTQATEAEATLVQAVQGAQTATPLPNMQGVVLTDSANIDIEKINKAAESLKAKGYDVAILFMDGDVGRSEDEAEGYFQSALESYSLGQGQDIFTVNENLVAVFVGTNPLTLSEGTRPIIIYTGDQVDLDTTQLRNEFMVPELVKGNFTKAITDTLSNASKNIKALPGFSNAGGSSGGFPAWLIPFVAVLAFLGLSRRRQSRKGQAKVATNKVENSRANTVQGNSGNDSGTLQKAATEDLSNFDIESSNISLEEKAELKQKKIITLKNNVSEALVDLDSSGEKAARADSYLPSDPNEQTDFVLIKSMAEEDRPDLVKDLEFGYSDARRKLDEASAEFSYLSENESTIGQDESIRRYEDVLSKVNDAKGFSRELSSTYADLQADVDGMPKRLEGAKQLLSVVEADYISQEGSDQSKQVFLPHYKRLMVAQAALESDRPLKAEGYIESVEEDLLSLREKTQQRTELRSNLPNRLTDLKHESEKTGRRIEEGRVVFDQVDDYAPSTWRDIRGNGSKAELLKSQADEVWSQANLMQQNDEVIGADARLDEAQEDLEQANNLINAIEVRLTDLQNAKATAQSQLNAVRQELRAERSYIDSLSQQDGHTQGILNKADVLLEGAEAEMASLQPDWLRIISDIQEADRLSDEAAERAREQQEVYEQHKRIANSEEAEAVAAFDRVAKYIVAHPEHQSTAIKSEVERLRQDFSVAQPLLRSDNIAGFDEAARRFDSVEQRATQLFERIEQQAKLSTTLKNEINQDLERAEKKLNELFRYREANNSIRQSVDQLRNEFPSTARVASLDYQGLERYKAELKDYNDRVDRMLRQAKQFASRFPNGSAGNFGNRNRGLGNGGFGTGSYGGGYGRGYGGGLDDLLGGLFGPPVRNNRRYYGGNRNRGGGLFGGGLPPIIINPPSNNRSIPRSVPRSAPRSAPRVAPRSAPRGGFGSGGFGGGSFGSGSVKRKSSPMSPGSFRSVPKPRYSRARPTRKTGRSAGGW